MPSLWLNDGQQCLLLWWGNAGQEDETPNAMTGFSTVTLNWRHHYCTSKGFGSVWTRCRFPVCIAPSG